MWGCNAYCFNIELSLFYCATEVSNELSNVSLNLKLLMIVCLFQICEEGFLMQDCEN